MRTISGRNIIRRFAIDMRIRVGYGTAFFLLLISYLLTLYANSELLKQAKLVDHTNKIIIYLEAMLSSMKDAETGCRGYMITKDSSFLQPYQKSRSVVDSAFELVSLETADNPARKEQLSALKDLINRKFSLLAFSIDYYSHNNYELTDTLKSNAYFGKEIMDHIRDAISHMQSEEQALLRNRSDEMSSRYKTLNVIVVTSLVIAFFLVVYGFITYTRENKARRKADLTVFEYQEQLKQQIEELNKANKELVQMRSMEKLAATGRIARTIAHEVRNPLTNIILSVDQIKMDANDHNENSTAMLEIILRNCTRINQLITDLLNSTKSAELIHQKISINRILDETLLLAKDRIVLNNIRVEKFYTEDICDISVDVEKLKIAFLNIIVNAIEAMQPDQGVLALKTESKNDKCVVSIQDNGSGIDKESLTKLFEPFFTSKPKGTGLGLANAYNIIISHNGQIHVESEVGNGTLVTIILNFS
jgi:signal transduction histidine kinase